MAFDIPVIETERLRLRAFAAADLDAYATMCADAEVMRFVGDGGPIDRDAAWRQMALFLGHWPLRGFGMWALEERTSGAGVWPPKRAAPRWPGARRSASNG